MFHFFNVNKLEYICESSAPVPSSDTHYKQEEEEER